MKSYRLKDSLKRTMTLIVSLPENSESSAKAIESAGAHSIKVHLNCVHRASKTHFKTWTEEKEAISNIPNLLDIPVGIVPGAETTASMEEMRNIVDCGFDFLDIFSHHMPPEYLSISELTKSTAIDFRFDLNKADMLEKLGVEIIESSIIPPQEYGQPLTVNDLVLYKTLISSVKIPVFIPTQRKVKPEEIGYLREIGASGIAIGAVVTGNSLDGVLRMTEKFRKAIDKLG